MARKHRYMLPNQAILKDYQGQKYKAMAFRWLAVPGQEIERDYVEKGSVNDHKLENNLSRARSKIYELVVCNPWDFVVTLTLNKEKHDRYDLEQWNRRFGQFTRDERKRIKRPIKSLLIPQKHKDGAWHMHGFLEGLPYSELRDFEENEKTEYIREALAKGRLVKTWSNYHEKFGFSVVEPIRNRDAAAAYALRYITREMQNDLTEVGKHLYYRSRGLLESLEIGRGTMVGAMMPDYENEYVAVQWIDGSENRKEVKRHFFGH